jgi:hypothetical protein
MWSRAHGFDRRHRRIAPKIDGKSQGAKVGSIVGVLVGTAILAYVFVLDVGSRFANLRADAWVGWDRLGGGFR